MKKILFLIIFFICVNPSQAEIFSLNNYNSGYFKQDTQTLRDMLLFAEKQIFDKTYKKNSLTERLERLELAVYGAIQDGSEAYRIQNIKRALTNVASGGNGLQYVTKSMDLTKNNNGGSFWSFGNSSLGYGNFYNDCAHNRNWHRPHNHHYKNHSHRMPPPCHHSHRLPPPGKHSYNNNPIVNGDFSKNYSLGTSVRILND